jgi:hypothetical protein
MIAASDQHHRDEADKGDDFECFATGVKASHGAKTAKFWWLKTTTSG